VLFQSVNAGNVFTAMSSAKGHPTLVEVAAAAGVSLSTASRALRPDSSVQESTRRRVRAAARRLGYEPNRLARSLRTRASSFAGVIVPDIGVGFYARAVKGAQDALERAGYEVILMNTERQASRETAALRTLLAHRVDGVLVATSGGFTDTPRVPVVFFDNLLPGAGAGHVAKANKEGMALLVGHLLTTHRHERIAYVGGPPQFTSGIERLEGFHTAMTGAGLEVPSQDLCFGDDVWSVASGRAAVADLLSSTPRPTAIVAAGDTLAVGAIHAVRELGLRVPEDVAVVSFDDPFFADLLDPPITALARNERALGELAASLLLHAIQTGSLGPPTEVRVPVELIIRRSCGCSTA
jgi:LacI family transcriptional regulator, galactose operon repressor